MQILSPLLPLSPPHPLPTLYSLIPPLEIRVVPKFLSTLSFPVPYRVQTPMYVPEISIIQLIYLYVDITSCRPSGCLDVQCTSCILLQLSSCLHFSWYSCLVILLYICRVVQMYSALAVYFSSYLVVYISRGIVVQLSCYIVVGLYRCQSKIIYIQICRQV